MTQLIDGGNLDLTISLVAAGGGKEWVVLNYQTLSADLAAVDGGAKLGRRADRPAGRRGA